MYTWLYIYFLLLNCMEDSDKTKFASPKVSNIAVENEKNREDEIDRVKKKLENEMKSLPIFLVILLVFSCCAVAVCLQDLSAGILFSIFVLIFWCRFVKGIVWYRILLKHVKNWTVVKKKAEITKFSYYYKSGNKDHSSESWYDIVASDWDYSFTRRLEGAWLNVWSWLTIDKEYLLSEGIPFSPDDSKFDEVSIDRRNRDLECKIESLNEQLKYVWWLDKMKIKSEIIELQKEKSKWIPIWLIYEDKIFFIWDVITVYVSPDNPKYYFMDI